MEPQHGDSTATFGCERCYGPDAPAAWEAMRAIRVHSLTQESHFGVNVTACSCGQRFVMVFTERIDWAHGEDPQDWLVLPVSGEELAVLTTCEEDQLERVIEEFGRGRRFLVRSYPSDGGIALWWQNGNLWIGPHD